MPCSVTLDPVFFPVRRARRLLKRPELSFFQFAQGCGLLRSGSLAGKDSTLAVTLASHLLSQPTLSPRNMVNVVASVQMHLASKIPPSPGATRDEFAVALLTIRPGDDRLVATLETILFSHNADMSHVRPASSLVPLARAFAARDRLPLAGWDEYDVEEMWSQLGPWVQLFEDGCRGDAQVRAIALSLGTAWTGTPTELLETARGIVTSAPAELNS